jgi:hypothetical protein
MKKICVLMIILAALALVVIGIMAAERDDTTVKVTKIDGRVSGNRRAEILFALNKKTPLTFRDVTITPAGAYEDIIVQNSSRDGKRWTVFILGFTETPKLTVTITKEGYTFEPPSKTVEIGHK